MNPKLKQTRARSKDKKAVQFERILEAGKKLFLKKGTRGFSMRNLAKILEMNRNNLYNYVGSKRELWIAIRDKFYRQFKEENLRIIKNHNGPIRDLIIKLYDHFLEFADRDYDKFRMMFNIIEAPNSKKIGPIEKKYKSYKLLDGTTELIMEAIENGEILYDNAPLLSLISFSIIMGVAYIEMFRSLEPNEVWETRQLSVENISKEELRGTILDVLELIFKTNTK